MAGRADYIINTIGKKHLVCVRRTGRDAHYSEFAYTTSEAAAGKIVEALNLHQRKKVEIESVIQRTLNDVRAELVKERERNGDLRKEKFEAERKTRTLQEQLRGVEAALAKEATRAIKAESRAEEFEKQLAIVQAKLPA